MEIYNFALYFAVSYLEAPLCRLLYHCMCWIIRMGYVLGEVRWKMRQVNSEHWHILYMCCFTSILNVLRLDPMRQEVSAGLWLVSFLVLLRSRYITIINILMMPVYQIVPAENYHLHLLYRHNSTIPPLSWHRFQQQEADLFWVFLSRKALKTHSPLPAQDQTADRHSWRPADELFN